MNILNELWEELEKTNVSSFKNPSGYKVLRYLNKDRLQSIIIDDESKKYWLESSEEIPRYVFSYIKKWCKSKGYRYLYDRDL